MSKRNIFVSVGIPFYNAEEYLASAVKSVINQSFQDWELILMDDGSTDESLRIAKEFEQLDNRVRVISDGLNKKLPFRLNQIIDESKGEYIARMDADDISHPDRLKVQLDFLKKNIGYDLVSTGLISINSDSHISGARGVESIHTKFEKINRAYPIVHPSVIARKDWYMRNKYDTNYSRCEDFELWCRAINNNDLKLAVLPDLLYYYREEGNLYADKILKSYKDGFQVYTKYKGKFDVYQFIKFRVKVLVVLGMDKFGFLQNSAGMRNNKSLSKNSIEKHQKILNDIVSFRINSVLDINKNS